jgi:hypothetical protein
MGAVTRLSLLFVLLGIAAGCNNKPAEKPPAPAPSASPAMTEAPAPANPEAPAANPEPAAANPGGMPLTQEEKDALKREITSYEVAVDRIRTYRETIRERIGERKPTEAQRSLDELDLVLEWLPATAKDSNIAEEHWEKVNTAAQTLRNSYNEVHARIDGGKDPGYGAVGAQIDTAIADLESVPTM